MRLVCNASRAQAEDESAIVFPALEREFNTLVPTQRLWNKINDSIATERENRSFWQRAWAFLTVTVANPSLAAAAGVLLVIGIFSLLWINRIGVPVEVAVVGPPASTNVVPIASSSIQPDLDRGDQASTVRPVSAPRVVQAAYRPEIRPRNLTAVSTVNNSSAAVAGAAC